jgi:hydroxymethylbilane synthase
MNFMKIRIGTRGSQLALWQAEHVAELLGKERTEIVIIKTQGDQILNVSFDKMEGKGFFTKEIEAALLDNRIDLAVHSLKDLPTESVPELTVAAIPVREEPSDVLLIRKESYEDTGDFPVKKGAVVGTSSLRRLAQLKYRRNDLEIKALRGNVNTRLRKLNEGEYDAIVLAYAGMKRVDLDTEGLEVFTIPYEIFLPAPAQGALGLQTRRDDHETIKAVEHLNHDDTLRAVTAERSFLHHFGGGCHIPLGALAVIENEEIYMQGVVASTDGRTALKDSIRGIDPEAIGLELAKKLKDEGADTLL